MPITKPYRIRFKNGNNVGSVSISAELNKKVKDLLVRMRNGRYSVKRGRTDEFIKIIESYDEEHRTEYTFGDKVFFPNQ